LRARLSFSHPPLSPGGREKQGARASTGGLCVSFDNSSCHAGKWPSFSHSTCAFVQYTGGWFQPPSTSQHTPPNPFSPSMHGTCALQHSAMPNTPQPRRDWCRVLDLWVESSPRTAQPCTPAAQPLTHPTPRGMCLPTLSDAQPLLRSATDRPTRPTPSQRPGPTTNLQSTPSPPRHQPAANFPCCQPPPLPSAAVSNPPTWQRRGSSCPWGVGSSLTRAQHLTHPTPRSGACALLSPPTPATPQRGLTRSVSIPDSHPTPRGM